MSSLTITYLATVALHAAVLSIVAAGLLSAIRQPSRRSFVAVAGLLAMGVLPWFTALRPEQSERASSVEMLPQVISPTLPAWTVVTLSAPEVKETVRREMVAKAPTAFVFPEPVESIVSVWFIGTGAGLILLVCALFRTVFWSGSLLPMDDEAWERLAAVSSDLPDRSRFLLSDTTTSPCVTGFFRPRIVLPCFLLEKEAEQQLSWALGHELAHLRAGDSRWMIVFSFIRCANWWNPLAHRLVSQWSDAREQLCDLHATGASEDRADYGRFLVTMAARISRQPGLAVTMARRVHTQRLKQRILCLLEARTGRAQPVGRGFIGWSSALLLLFAVAVSAIRIDAEAIPELSAESSDSAEELLPPASPPLPFPAPETTPAEASTAAVTGRTPARQLKMTSKLITTPERSKLKDGELLSDEEVQRYLKSLYPVKGLDLVTLPSITARSGQSAIIEIVKEVGTDPAEPPPFIGIKLGMKNERVGEKVKLDLDVDYRFVSDRRFPGITNEEARAINPADVKMAKHSISPTMDFGKTVVCDMGEIEPGKFLQLMVFIVELTQNGEEIGAHVATGLSPRENPPFDENPSALGTTRAREGRLKLDAVVIDIPRNRGLPEHVRFFKYLSSGSDDSLEALVSHYKLKKRNLPPVEIPLAGPTAPWPEFPGIRLSAKASEDLRTLVLINDSEQNGRSGISPLESGGLVHIDVQSGDPSIERRIYMTVTGVK
ncbi:MAG: M56 family metallopeptidase [Verrucomicrobiaceae bacterium]|nr:MAG: M56 family metallopeptidase [Verrucomicrobiaceae bacterium]